MKKNKLFLSLLASSLLVGALAGCSDDIRGESVSINADIEITESVDSQYIQPEYLNFGYYKSGKQEYLEIALHSTRIKDEVINIAPQYGGYDVKYYFTFAHDNTNPFTKKIIFPDTMLEIDGEVFSNFQALEEIVLSKNIRLISPIAFYHSDIKKITVDPLNEYYEVKNDALFQKKDNHFVHYLNNEVLTQYVVYQATDVEDFAFVNTDLTSIVFSEGVERISSYAFDENEKLESITLPSTFTGFAYSYGYDGGYSILKDDKTGEWVYRDDPRFEALYSKKMIEIIKNHNSNLKTIYSHKTLDLDLSDLGIDIIKL